MEFKEQTLEDIIWENIQTPGGRKLLKERGLDVSGYFYRQLELGNYGRADLVSVDYDKKKKKVVITIYELKKKKIGEDALMQACRYLTALQRHGFDDDSCKCKFEYRIRLIGDSIQRGDDFVYLYNALSFVDIYTYNYKINGIFFDFVSHNWCRTEENLNIETSNLLQQYIDDCIKVNN